MILFKHCVKEVNGLSFVFEHLPLCSALGKSFLLNHPLMTEPADIQNELDNMERYLLFRRNHPELIKALILLLHDVSDIRQTIENLHALKVLDDIELFEVKKLAYVSQKMLAIFQQGQYADYKINDLSKVWSLLDPENTQIPHFYIYSAYDEELAALRKQLLKVEDADEREKLMWEATRKEDEIRQKISEMLHPYAAALQHNQSVFAELDLLNAKCQLADEWGWCKPVVSAMGTKYVQLYQPEVKAVLADGGRRFQPIDIVLHSQPCLITGANMSGKTVLLKAISLAQHLFQFGFYVPATAAEITIVDQVFCIIDDQQNERHGLSSFAVELLNMNKIIKFVKNGGRSLVLVDELARTTNPEEGKRLVNAFVQIMQKYEVMAVVTTHYGQIPSQCRRLRVKGLTVRDIPQNVTPKELSQYMDYTLEETTSTDVPTEALRIAEIFHIDSEFLELAKQS